MNQPTLQDIRNQPNFPYTEAGEACFDVVEREGLRTVLCPELPNEEDHESDADKHIF